MFLRSALVKSGGKAVRYWKLVENYGTERGTRQRVVAHLGRLENILQPHWSQDQPGERLLLKIDGKYARWVGPDGVSRYVSVVDSLTAAFDVTAGEHVLELERLNGDTAIQVPLALGAGTHNEVIVYGGHGEEQSRVFLDALRFLPAARARVSAGR